MRSSAWTGSLIRTRAPVRELTQFEREHGYTPCPFTLGDALCGVEAKMVEAMAPATCDGTVLSCEWWCNLSRFGGQPIPGHPLARFLLAVAPTFQGTTIDP